MKHCFDLLEFRKNVLRHIGCEFLDLELRQLVKHIAAGSAKTLNFFLRQPKPARRCPRRVGLLLKDIGNFAKALQHPILERYQGIDMSLPPKVIEFSVWLYFSEWMFSWQK